MMKFYILNIILDNEEINATDPLLGTIDQNGEATNFRLEKSNLIDSQPFSPLCFLESFKIKTEPPEDV